MKKYEAEPGFNISIKKVNFKQEVVEVICGNVDSADWLRFAVIPLNRNLKCKPLEDVSLQHLPSFIIWVYERNDDFEEVRRTIGEQGICTSNWIHLMTYDGKVAGAKVPLQGRKFYFLGDKELAEKFKQGNELTMAYKRRQQTGKAAGARIQRLKGIEDHALSSPDYILSLQKKQ